MTVKIPRFALLISKSPAIGHDFVKQFQVYMLQNRSVNVTIDGRKMALPRYYKRKIFDGYEDIKQEINDKLARKVEAMRLEEIDNVRHLYPNMSDVEIENLITKIKHDYNRDYFRTAKG